MASRDGSPCPYFQPIDYDEKLEQRAVRHRKLGDRNNVTTCRSPTRDLDTRWMKNELHRKRQEEFSKRRPASCGVSPLLSTRARRNYLREEERMTHTSTSFSRTLTPGRSTGSIKVQSFPTASMNDENGPGLKPESVPNVLDTLRQRWSAKKERMLLRDITQLTNNQRTLYTASAQTESGISTVKEADVQQLAEYLEEALYREETLKKKLTALQRSAATLLRSTELLWKTRCDEDVLKSKIKALEAQLQLCMKRVPQDGMKKVVLKMEKEKEEYEQKAMEAIRRATEENAEAQSQMQNLQEALQATQEESMRWQTQCVELRDNCSLLRNSQDMCVNQLLQLQGQLERSRGQEESLREQCETLQQHSSDLQSSIALLEQDNMNLREQLEDLTEQSHGSFNNMRQVYKQEHVLDQLLGTDTSIAEQLRQAEERFSLKEKECAELKAELEALEQECYSYQTRLAQCRDELNALSTRNTGKSKRGCCGFFFCLTLFFMLLLVAVMAAAWIYHPPIREHLRDLYSVMEEKVEDYLMQAVSAQRPDCFRPI